MDKIKVQQRQLTTWEKKQQGKVKHVIKSGFDHRNKWATPKEKQGMFAKKALASNYSLAKRYKQIMSQEA